MADTLQRFDSNYDRIQSFRFFDDIFFRAVMSNNREAIEFILNTIFGRDDIKIIDFETQKDMKNLHGRSSIFDVWARDSNGNLYNIEVERTNSHASPLNTRWHGALLDSYSLKPGQDVDKLPNTYVIYITEKDIFGEDAPVYKSSSFVELKNGLVPYNNGTHTYIVNGSYEGDDEIGRLMHDFRTIDPDEMYNKILAERARYFKSNKKGYEEMSKIVDEIKQEGKQEGITIGIDLGIFEMVKKLFSNGYSYDQVKDLKPKLSEEMILKAQQEALQSL